MPGRQSVTKYATFTVNGREIELEIMLYISDSPPDAGTYAYIMDGDGQEIADISTLVIGQFPNVWEFIQSIQAEWEKEQ